MIRSVIFTFIVRLASAVLSFFVMYLLSRELGPEGKGICAKYIAVIANALIFCDFLGGPAIVYLVARHRVSNILLPCYLWSAVTSLAVMFVFLRLGEIDFNEFVVLSALSFLNSCTAIHQNILSGKMQITKLNIIMLVQTLLVFASLKYFFSLTGPLTVNYIWALAVSWGFTALLGFFFVLGIAAEGEPLKLRSFFRSAFGFGFINIAGHTLQFFNQRLSYFLLNNRLLGVFSNAVQIGESVWMISNSIATVQYGKISNTQVQATAEKISLIFLKINMIFCFAGALALALLPDAFFVWIFGEEFAGIHPVLLFLFPGLVFYSGYLIIGHHFSGRGKFIKNLYSIICGLVFTLAGLVIVYFLRSGFGMIEAAVITSVSYAGNFICALVIFKRDAAFRLSHFLPTRDDISFVRSELRRKSGPVSGAE